MMKSVKPPSSSFERIREGLDPACSYVIFEKSAGSGKDPEFSEVVRILEKLGLSVHQTRAFRDEAREKLLLVVKFDLGRVDEIVQEIVSVGLPDEVTFYAYGSRLAD